MPQFLCNVYCLQSSVKDQQTAGTIPTGLRLRVSANVPLTGLDVTQFTATNHLWHDQWCYLLLLVPFKSALFYNQQFQVSNACRQQDRGLDTGSLKSDSRGPVNKAKGYIGTDHWWGELKDQGWHIQYCNQAWKEVRKKSLTCHDLCLVRE